MEKILLKGGTTNCLVIVCFIHWVTKAFQYMVVHHADRLHKRVADGRSDKLESVFF
jgi:hypothetical protein